MKKFAVLLLCCFISAFFCIPSFAVSDQEPSDSSYSIQEDVSILSVPPVQTLAASSTRYTPYNISLDDGSLYTYYLFSGMEDGNLESGLNAQARSNRDTLSALSASVSSAMTQGGFEASMDKFWEFFDLPYLKQDGSIGTSEGNSIRPKDWLREGLMGLAVKIGLGFPSGKSFFVGDLGNATTSLPNAMDSGYYLPGPDLGSGGSFVNFYLYANALMRSVLSVSDSGVQHLYPNGQVSGYESYYYLSDATRDGFLGLAHLLRGVSGSASFAGNLLSSFDLSQRFYSADNLLSALAINLNIQNDLARLTHVIADPSEQALHDATKDNVQSVTDNLTGEKGVTSHDIGDLSGISSGVGDFMTTGVSPDRLTGSISDEGNYSFFSQQTADDLHTFPAPQSADDDFIDFYAINRQAYSSLLGGDFDG